MKNHYNLDYHKGFLAGALTMAIIASATLILLLYSINNTLKNEQINIQTVHKNAQKQ